MDAGTAEEIHEDAFVERCVGVGEYAYRAAFAKHFQNRARGAVFFDRLISGEAAIAIDERVDARIGDGPHQEMQRVAVERVREGREFPCAHVAGEEQDAFAAALGALEIFGAVDDHDLSKYSRRCISGIARTRRPSSRSGESFRG